MSDVPEELLPDPEGGRCFTPFPNTDVWTNGETPSPWGTRKHEAQKHARNVKWSQIMSPDEFLLTSSLLGEWGPCATLPEFRDIFTWHFTSLSYTPLYWLRNLSNNKIHKSLSTKSLTRNKKNDNNKRLTFQHPSLTLLENWMRRNKTRSEGSVSKYVF